MAAATSSLLNEKEVAELLHVSVGTLQVWRSTKRYALPYVKLATRVVRYRPEDIQTFIDGSTVRRPRRRVKQ
jgi:predicted DNA-binding transcriptional regulator AlpA